MAAAGHSRRERAAGLAAALLAAEFGHALRASAGASRTQPGPATPAGGPQAGQPGAVGQQFGYAAGNGHGHDRPDPATRQRQPFPRSSHRGILRRATHDPLYFPRSPRWQSPGPRDPGRPQAARQARAAADRRRPRLVHRGRRGAQPRLTPATRSAEVTSYLRSAALLNVPIRPVVSEVNGQCRAAVTGPGLIDKTLTIRSLMTAARPVDGYRGTGLLPTMMRRARNE
jgi:hypothetical protein